MSEQTNFTELITVRDFLRFAVSRFRQAELSFGHGTTTALDDAAFLLLESLHLPIDSLEPWLDARLTRSERATLAAVIENRVVTRKPSAYLTRSAYIGPHRFYVDERVIVPRSFIGELLCDADSLPFGLAREPRRILDLCTGSGCLAVVAAHAFPAARVTAADISTDALAVAADNIARHNLGLRVDLVQTDLFARLGGLQFDLILCNPPYVTTATVAGFPSEHKAEPVLAHIGGDDGMDLVRRILAEAGGHLARDGVLIMEIGQGRPIMERDFKLPFVWLDTEHSEGEVFALEAAALHNDGKSTAKRVKGTSRR